MSDGTGKAGAIFSVLKAWGRSAPEIIGKVTLGISRECCDSGSTLGPWQLWLMVRGSEHRTRKLTYVDVGALGFIGASVDSSPVGIGQTGGFPTVGDIKVRPLVTSLPPYIVR